VGKNAIVHNQKRTENTSGNNLNKEKTHEQNKTHPDDIYSLFIRM